MNDADDFRPTASWANLQLRADLLRRVREFFHVRDFVEVETPILSADVTVDRHLDPLSVILPRDVRQPEIGRRMWLQTSPEFGMKRLLAATSEAVAIYQITRAFRAGESGLQHNPEFTIVEWYRVGDSMAAGMQLLADLAQALLGSQLAERLSYADAFARHAGIDPHRATTAEFQSAAAARGITITPNLAELDRDGWSNLLLAELVEPHLGVAQPTILFDYPASQAALAKTRPQDSPVAERFELYVRGVELANGYHELLDPKILRDRNTAANSSRVADGKPPLPEQSRLLAAMDHGLPACTGVALGFDRLVMLAAGAKTLAEVMAFPIDRA